MYLNRGQNILRKRTWRFHLCRGKTCTRVHNLYKLQKAVVQFHTPSRICLLFCSYFRRKCPRPLHVFILFFFFFFPSDRPSFRRVRAIGNQTFYWPYFVLKWPSTNWNHCALISSSVAFRYIPFYFLISLCWLPGTEYSLEKFILVRC